MSFNLLIVDDSELVRASLISLLERIAGVDVIDQAVSLADALLCLQRQTPALVILDLRLPDGLGFELIPALKRHEPKVLIAMLTFHADDRYREKCLAMGADWFFDKATQCDDLFEVVRVQAQLHTSATIDKYQNYQP